MKNMVLSDLPAGNYTVSLLYLDKWKRSDFTIAPELLHIANFKEKMAFHMNYRMPLML